MRRLARCGKPKNDPNICRNLHRAIQRARKILPVKVSYVHTLMRRARKKPVAPVRLPILKPSDWAKCSFSRGGHFFLGGKDLTQAEQVGDTLQTFWERWKETDPDFCLYKDFPDKRAWRTAVPVAVHGDEGRGRLKRPVLVVSVQSIIPMKDFKTNMQGFLVWISASRFLRYYPCLKMMFPVEVKLGLFIFWNQHVFRSSMCTRLLYAVLPSPYTQDNVTTILEELTSDLLDLYRNGLEELYLETSTFKLSTCP